MAVFHPQVEELDQRRCQWLSDLDRFKSALRAKCAEPKVLEYVNEAFGRFIERIQRLAN